MKRCDEIKEKSFIKPVGMNVSNFKNKTLFVFLRQSLAPEISDGTNFHIGNRVINGIKIWRKRPVDIIVPYGTNFFLQICQIDDGRFTDVKFATFTETNTVNDVGGGVYKIVPKNETGFRSGNRCGRFEERTRVTTSTRARKGTHWFW